jgi:hypothetical protein
MTASNSPLLKLRKPEPKKKAQARAKRQKAKARATCRVFSYERSEGCCEGCGRWLVLRVSQARHEFEIAHIHEVQLRSLGGSAIDPANTKVLCHACHDKEHGK